MNIWQIATRSFKHYLRSNVAIALGVAAATAVLTGALIVGDSMRHSLHGLTMERLGAIDELLISEGFFRAKLADEIASTCLLYTSPSPRDATLSRMPSSA